MSSYQHKSGAQKRREKEQRDKEVKKGALTLSDVGVKKELNLKEKILGLPSHAKIKLVLHQQLQLHQRPMN